jgi:hypothetical protein
VKKHLFYVFLTIFCLTAGVTLLGVTRIVSIEEFYLKGLFGAFIVELGGAVIALYRKAEFFEPDSTPIAGSSPPGLRSDASRTTRELQFGQPGTVIVSASSERDPNEGPRPPALVPLHRVSSLGYDDIMNTLRNTPPLLALDMAKRYAGILVDWSTTLQSAEPGTNGTVTLTLKVSGADLGLVLCEVHLADYRELGIAPRGLGIRVTGEIEKVVANLWISLRCVQLFFTSQEPVASDRTG